MMQDDLEQSLITRFPLGSDQRVTDSLPIFDALLLLKLAGKLALMKEDAQRCKLELLAGINRAVGASASASFSLTHLAAIDALKGPPPQRVGAFFELGLNAEQRRAFFHELNTRPLSDAFSRLALQHFIASHADTATLVRSTTENGEEIAGGTANASWGLIGAMDRIISLHRPMHRGTVHVLMIFKENFNAYELRSAAPSMNDDMQRFTARDRLLVDTLHRGIDWLYSIPNPDLDLNRSMGLSPQLQKTLELLVTGQTEHQVANTMSLSVHTVHDYVKQLYRHLAVNNRTELLAKWAQRGGTLPSHKDSG